jgi:uncharacterized surface protein with fasciclin (FAS1) repeats
MIKIGRRVFSKMVRTSQLFKLVSSIALAASAAIPLAQAQPASANTSWVEVSACPVGLSIFAVEDDLSLPAPTVDFNLLPNGPGAQARLVGSITGEGVPGGIGRQYIYWNDIKLTPGTQGTVIARGARNESYATFTVANDCPPLGSVRGSAFEDFNTNGVRDLGEPGIGTASWKVTTGGDWFICGFVGGDSTYGPTVTPGTYTVLPIAQPGWRATTPPRQALVKTLGFAALNNDIGFVKVASSAGDNCGQYAPVIAPQPSPILLDAATTLANYKVFNTLLAAANAAGVTSVLAGPGPYTILAPTDAAFTHLSPARLNALLRNPKQLAELLKCHIIHGVVDPAQLVGAKGKTFRTLGVRSVTLRVAKNGQLLANNANIGEIIPTSNGQIFALDRVLFFR